MTPVATEVPATTRKTLLWEDSSSTSAPATLRSILQVHLSLSQQLSQALFTSLHAAHSTALPPSPIPRPAQLPVELESLPIWTLPPNASPTSKELIPSLAILHTSLDEYLLRARTHRANARRIRELTEEVRELQSSRRDRVRVLGAASRELKEIVLEGREEVKKIKRAKAAPLDYHQVLAYAADLARTTSAPPGYSEAKLLKEGVEAALTQPAAQDRQPSPHSDAVPVTEIQVAGGAVSAPEGEGSVPRIVVEGAKKEEAPEPPPTPAAGVATAQPNTASVDTTVPQPAAAAAGPTQTRFLHPEEEGDPHNASSAPQLLPFPSDAEMRRGLMGVAMLDESGAGMKGILPAWQAFREQWQSEHGGGQQQSGGKMELGEADRPEVQRREKRTRTKVEEVEEDLGLDLN
ncbi:hypothetical protein BCV69DRAFT_297338 [Microstroma glucosiphilum]|uniref:Mediator of RNA polymerase II transcription subunit 4 n=1 Tax=Pseudomicrostroma glucosiphilum TaxID=1684307 RepID=A0A316UES3_9BASI|nr:hypothetical protein BCV69DRAFT_297338 [Pseudomicrostroma glucosiphilum]PWN23404.1 hypothetical protein BCV69DRAFT_297338 [Pseudomicrostroma glucosiphilum]